MSGTPKSLQDHLIKLTMLNAKIKAESNPIKQLELYLSYLKQVNKSLKTFLKLRFYERAIAQNTSTIYAD